jgi:hypothetical protein
MGFQRLNAIGDAQPDNGEHQRYGEEIEADGRFGRGSHGR